MENHELNEILKALKLYSEENDKWFSELENRFSKLENRMDDRFDRLEKKLDGMRVELTETQETVDYLASKSAQHEKKLRKLYQS
ncbi:hypothetical protein [Oceanobacillus kapialis]|uniref:Uncharacterized protein n=1 Tax=Oceanobacillus kapialis TaxID=481353 RepID=A0ABW5Q2X2_9BACI